MPINPGDLVEIDSIHLNLERNKRVYIVSLLDCFSRWAFAKAVRVLSSSHTARFLGEAKLDSPFTFQCIQSDHGSEFSKHFTNSLKTLGIRHRHIRVRKPNDNAHIERFNRTLKEEMGRGLTSNLKDLPKLNMVIKEYINYYNTQRLHLGLNGKTPQEVLPRS
jgi:putative transposase